MTRRGWLVWYYSAVSSGLQSQRRPTYADIEALPPHVVGEILGGQLIVSPRPAGSHAGAASSLGSVLNVLFERGLGGPGGWWIIFEPELSLGVDPDFDPVVPDIAGWRAETMVERFTSAQAHTTPDWVCEVLSPGTARHDRLLKMPFYGRAGVSYLWLVDPVSELIEAFELVDGRWTVITTVGGDGPIQLAPFESAVIELAPLWGRRSKAQAD